MIWVHFLNGTRKGRMLTMLIVLKRTIMWEWFGWGSYIGWTTSLVQLWWILSLLDNEYSNSVLNPWATDTQFKQTKVKKPHGIKSLTLDLDQQCCLESHERRLNLRNGVVQGWGERMQLMYKENVIRVSPRKASMNADSLNCGKVRLLGKFEEWENKIKRKEKGKRKKEKG